ncbi:MAG: OmpA family protein [Marinobacterium sp.]|nr:OmpA family protein [Marinobacterium sp.]
MSHIRELLKEETENTWLTTYADLMTLLLVFFVLLFSMSSLKKADFEVARRSLTLALDSATGNNSLIELDAQAPTDRIPEELREEKLPAHDYSLEDSSNPNSAEAIQQRIRIQRELEETKKEIEQSFQLASLSDSVEIATPKDGKLRLRMKGEVLFGSGSAEFNRGSVLLLDEVRRIMSRNPKYKVNIQGHTDDQPIETPQFPSNWELSAVRATTVLRYFMRGGISPERLTATGYGASMPLVSNKDSASRAENRRIEFVLEHQVK